jgi:hypothetical protein
MSGKSSLEFPMRAPRPETFEPEMLALLGAVYDDAWQTVAASYVHADADTLAEARAELAAIMLRLAQHQLATGELKDLSIRQFRKAMGRSATAHTSLSELAPAEPSLSSVSVPAS